jgi:hypothetical protein
VSTSIFAPGSFLSGREPLKLDFSGTRYAGLEVTARRTPMGMMRDAASVTEALGRSLISWNVTDEDGKPVPATAGGLAGRDAQLTAALGAAYLEAVAAEWRPLPAPKAAAAPSPSHRARARRGTGAAQ